MDPGIGFTCGCEANFLPQPVNAALGLAAANNALCAPAFGGPCAAVNDATTIPREDCVFPNERCVPEAGGSFCRCNENFAQNAATPPVCVESIGAPCPAGPPDCTLPGQGCIRLDGTVAPGPDATPGAQSCGCLPMFVDVGNGVCMAGTGAPCAATVVGNPGGDADCAPDMRCYMALPIVAPAIVALPNFADPMPNGPGICSCPTGLEPNGFMFQETGAMGMCVRSLGTACPDGACGLPNSQCSTDPTPICECTATTVDTNGAATAGGLCSAKVGDACPNGNECVLDNQVCLAAGVPVVAAGPGQTCGCAATFGPNADNTACLASVGAACPNGNECMLPNQVCRAGAGAGAIVTTAGANQNCGCGDNFAQNAAGECVAALGAACPTGNECTLPGQACSGGATPVCANTVGGACPLGNADCMTFPRQQCDDTTNPAAPVCGCDDGWVPDANNQCNDWTAGFCGGVMGGCAVGQGDCNDVRDCEDGLLCGVNNCGPTRPLADCCVDPTNPTGTAGAACDGTAPNVWGCCTPGNLCGVGEGDCDTDADCGINAAGVQLVCVADSCGAGFGNGNVFPAGQVDCCQLPTAVPFYSNFVDGMDKRIERWTNDEEPVRQRPKY